MSEEQLGKALEGVFQGAIVVLVGTVIGQGMGFITEVWVVRLFSQSQYGIFRLGILVTTLVGALATLGFTTALPRQLGVRQGEGATDQLRKTISAALLIGGVSALLLAVLLFAFAERVVSIFDTPSLVPVIRFFAFALPLVVLVDLFVAVARGLGDSKPKLYIQTIVPKLFFLGSVGVVAGLDLQFRFVLIGWLLGYVAALLAAVIYGTFKIDTKPLVPDFEISKELVAFALPLLAVYVINSVGSWVDTFVVGYYESAELVGLYSATILLTRLIPMILGSASFMYIPIASQFHSRDELDAVQMIYTTMTKWIAGLTLPIFMTFVLFPREILTTVFGPEFSSGATVMRLLALGFASHTLVGTNGQSLIMLGRRRFLALSQAVSVIANLAVSIALIPVIGIEGAALGSATAYVVTNFATSVYLYRVAGLHPFCREYLLPVTVSSFAAGVVGVVMAATFPISLKVVVGFAGSIGIIHSVVYLLTHSVNQAEVEMVQVINARSGLPLDPIVHLLKWGTPDE